MANMMQGWKNELFGEKLKRLRLS